jgi:predicted HTH transcriptional regulator
VWIPRSEKEIESTVANRSLEETVTFDAKREIPSKSFETAKDVCALANTAGGVLLYGIGEDQHGRPTVLNPLTLQGQR